MAVRHLRQQKNWFLGLRDEDGFGHSSDYDFGHSLGSCPARSVNGAHRVTRHTTKSERGLIGRPSGPPPGASSIQNGSVQVRLREWKRVPDQFHSRFRAVTDDHFDYIEAEKYVRVL